MVLLYNVDPGKVYNYFEEGYHHPPNRNRPKRKWLPHPKKLLFIFRLHTLVGFDLHLEGCSPDGGFFSYFSL